MGISPTMCLILTILFFFGDFYEEKYDKYVCMD
jgi:hypothetical protein